MKPFVSDTETAQKILAIAESWRGTPYVGDGAVKGSGVSCAMQPYCILTEAGFVIPPPPARGKALKCELLSIMLGWLMAHEETHFIRVPNEEAALGDVMLFDAGYGHLGLCLGDDNVIHSWQRGGSHIVKFSAPKFAARIVGVWRPAIPA